jgi:hypothetical protein
MAFSVDDLHSTAKLLSINKVQFLKELTYQDILGTTRHTIIVDPENNVVQLVE